MKFYTIQALIALFLLNSCQGTVDKLSRLDKSPDLSTINIYLPEPDDGDSLWDKEYRVASTNSLWCSNSTQFFKDNRPWSKGDLIRIKISIDDSAKLSTNATNKRNSSKSLGVPNFFGLENLISSATSGKLNPKSLIGTKSDWKHTGDSKISRSEDISTEIAATVVKVLSNGNLLISGSQEVRIENELRQIKVYGIISAKDITSTNSINVNQIAEATIIYGGKGSMSDTQQPPIGDKLLNILSPF